MFSLVPLNWFVVPGPRYEVGISAGNLSGALRNGVLSHPTTSNSLWVARYKYSTVRGNGVAVATDAESVEDAWRTRKLKPTL